MPTRLRLRLLYCISERLMEWTDLTDNRSIQFLQVSNSTFKTSESNYLPVPRCSSLCELLLPAHVFCQI